MNSHIVEQDQMYVRFNQQGITKLVSAKQLQPGYSYRRVHYTYEGEWRNQRVGNQLFVDPEYKIDPNQLSQLDYNNSKVIIKRLYDLYRQTPKNQKPEFFPTKTLNISRIKNHATLPPFVTELGILPLQHYKSLFLTQDFANHGLYQIIINQNGRYETDVVDDQIPVYADTLQPIWEMDLQHAWQIVLLKFWAKKNGSYLKVKAAPPFKFIQFFTNSNWKYFNLSLQGEQFLQYYNNKIPNGKFVLKTKVTDQVANSGLIRNSAGYQLLDLKEVTGNKNFKDQKYVIMIRSTLINKWSGDMSVLDKQINSKYQPSKFRMALQRDFMMNHTDFLNLFSSAYIASRRDKTNYYSAYYLLNIPPNNKNSIYLKFNVLQNGWFDFCIKQYDDIRVPCSTPVKVSGYSNDDGLRYLKVKYILVRDNAIGFGSLQVQEDYNPPKYDVFEIEYSHGYNKGDARFQNIVRGTYYLRIKIQKIAQPVRFVVNYASNSRIQMQQVKPTKQQTSIILRQAMASMIGQLSSYSLDVNYKYEQIVFANLFEQVGYGFVGVRMKKKCPYRLLIEVDPMQVRESGYKLKNQFKRINQPFSIIVAAGESTSVVLNKVNPNAQWPPRGIDIFKQK